MSTISLIWIGDLDQDRHKFANVTSLSDDHFRPRRIELKQNQKEIKIGRINSKTPADYPIESCINNRMISRNHATIQRLNKGGFMLYDHSMNGTYVNYVRVTGGIVLKNGDTVCFGHLNGANLKPGESVTPFYSDLKYKVELGPTKDNKRKSHSSQSGSIGSSHNSDNSDGSEVSVPSSKRKVMKKTRRVTSDDEEKNKKASAKLSRKSVPVIPRKSDVPKSKPKNSKEKRVKAEEVSTDQYHLDSEECSASTCKHPQDAAVDWIQCDKCSKWYHQVCIGCKPDEAESDTYYCPYCRH